MILKLIREYTYVIDFQFDLSEITQKADAFSILITYTTEHIIGAEAIGIKLPIIGKIPVLLSRIFIRLFI